MVQFSKNPPKANNHPNPPKANSHPKGENSPNLTTLFDMDFLSYQQCRQTKGTFKRLFQGPRMKGGHGVIN
jgi:hypothetical protein